DCTDRRLPESGQVLWQENRTHEDEQPTQAIYFLSTRILRVLFSVRKVGFRKDSRYIRAPISDVRKTTEMQDIWVNVGQVGCSVNVAWIIIILQHRLARKLIIGVFDSILRGI